MITKSLPMPCILLKLRTDMAYFGSGVGVDSVAGVDVSAGVSAGSVGVASGGIAGTAGAAVLVSTGTGFCGITNGPLLPQADRHRAVAKIRGSVYFILPILALMSD